MRPGPPYPKLPTFNERLSDGIITRVAFHLCAVKGDSYDPAGTAVALGPGIAVTAKHVVQDYITNLERGPLAPGGATSFSLLAVQTIDSGKAGVAYYVSKMTLHGSSDLALLELKPWSNVPLPVHMDRVAMRLVPPAVGERVVAFGYFGTEVELSENTVTVSRHMATTVGEVTDVYLAGRDSLLRWSSFATNARFEGGMSGGPVFTDDGALAGLVCTGMPIPEYGEHYSTVTSLWPLMDMEIDFDVPGRPGSPTYPVVDLLGGPLMAIDADRLVVSRGDGTVRVGLRVPRGALPPEA